MIAGTAERRKETEGQDRAAILHRALRRCRFANAPNDYLASTVVPL